MSMTLGKIESRLYVMKVAGMFNQHPPKVLNPHYQINNVLLMLSDLRQGGVGFESGLHHVILKTLNSGTCP